MNFPASDFHDISTDVHINHSVILARRGGEPREAQPFSSPGLPTDYARIHRSEEPVPGNLLLYA
jgi:hypothetical protein